ncbi:MAG: CopG family transcriptional regulator [Piscirickettsiaceae bacterium]|nr:MAG: CopG family transcriptional regulator [Piscirickettsiaceae bacterium]PCI71387.1 MAG: CopG family transcriptional regulator [Piscirickettsiaceae bacterium]
MAIATVKPIAVKLEIDIRERMKRLAETRHRTTHWIMKEAIQQYIEREEKREVFRQDAIKAWEEYQLTGLHASFDEGDTWLANLEAGQDIDLPECHV